MATYVNDLRLKEIATGDEAGTWGTSTNTNLELIGEALGFGTQDVFDTDANKTTTVADGQTDPARAMYFKVTSSATLTATRIMTIAPNTISRVMFIENATTGGQAIAVSQGSGGNVSIPNGETKLLYLDGAGSGAAAVDINANLVVDDLGNVLSSGNTSDSNNIQMSSGDEIRFRDADLKISSTADGQLDIDADTELEITAPTVDINGAVDVSGDLTVDTDTFFVDISEEKVGVNTTTLDSTLEVFGGALGGTSGDAVDVATFRTTSSNVDRLDISTERTATGSDWQSAAQKIQRRVDTTDMGYVQFGNRLSDVITFGSGTTEFAQIDNNGFLGLGVTPSVLLHLGTAAPQIRFDDTDANGICQIFQGTNVLYIRVDPNEADANSQLRFEVDNAEKLRIDDGKVSFYCGSELEDTTVTSSSNAATINLNNGDSFVHDLTENVTYTFSNPAPSGKASAFILKVIQDSTARTITWPSSVDWAGGTAPTLSTGNNDVDVFVFYTNDGGTTYYGSIVGQDFA